MLRDGGHGRHEPVADPAAGRLGGCGEFEHRRSCSRGLRATVVAGSVPTDSHAPPAVGPTSSQSRGGSLGARRTPRQRHGHRVSPGRGSVALRTLATARRGSSARQAPFSRLVLVIGMDDDGAAMVKLRPQSEKLIVSVAEWPLPVSRPVILGGR